MLNKIYRAVLVCALALPPASGALGYQEVCFNLKRAGYIATFKWALGHRDNPDGLDPYWSGRNAREGDAVMQGAGIVDGTRIHAHQRGCFDLTEVAGPGDRLRFYVEAHGGSTVECQPSGGPGASQDDEGFPGFWLVPDGPARGSLEFGADTGVAQHHWCARWSGELRMHSGCNTGINSMENAGCRPFAPRLTDTVTHDIVDQGRGLGMLGSVMRRGADINRHSRAHNENTPLHLAAWRGRPEYAEHLIRGGANLNSRNRQGSTPVLIAVYYGKNRALERLLDAGANSNYPNDLGDFPLHAAAKRGNLEAVRMLAEAGAHLDSKHQENGQSALTAAKSERRRDVVAYLRDQGAREDVYDAIVYDIVAEDRGVHRLRDAISRGADVNVTGEGGKTALHLAAERNLSRYVSDLLRNSETDREARDDQGRTPLISAVEGNANRPAAVLALLNGGADVNAAAANGDFPLYVAARNGRRDLVGMLVVANGVELNRRHSESGMTALGLARALSRDPGGPAHEAVVRALERRGAE